MTDIIKGDARIVVTEGGTPTDYDLATKIFRAYSPGQPEQSWTFESADYSTRRTVSIASSARDFRGTIRMDGHPLELENMIAALRRGATGEYYPSFAAGTSFPFDLVDAGEVRPDPDLWWDRRYTVDVHLRRRDGGTWDAELAKP